MIALAALRLALVAIWRLAMPCPGELAVGLVHYWNAVNPDPGGTPTNPPTIGGALGYLQVIITDQPVTDQPVDLQLARTDRVTGATLAVETGWGLEPLINGGRRDTFNGRGTALLPQGTLSLADVGDGVTLAARLWAAGGTIQGGAPGPLAKPQQLLGVAGQYNANPTQEAGLSVLCPDPTAGSPAARLRQWDGASAAETAFAGAVVPGGSSNPFLVVLTLRRTAPGPTGIRAVLYVNGSQAGQPIDGVVAQYVALNRVTFGDMLESDNSLTQAAAWKLALSPGLIAQLGESLDCLGFLPPVGGGGPESDDPLLTEFGETAIHPEWVVPRHDRAGVLATDGPQRHTRRVHEVVPRVYELAIRLGDGRDAELVRRALHVTRGARPTRWRHPKDDPPGPVSTAPRWLIENADAFALERARGAHVASMTLVLREVP